MILFSLFALSHPASSLSSLVGLTGVVSRELLVRSIAPFFLPCRAVPGFQFSRSASSSSSSQEIEGDWDLSIDVRLFRP
uniref:Putative secreted protein n=1 Tax=Anopheles marajoara TaxID=58244 RepID=A0A2M4CD58_9DIPT